MEEIQRRSFLKNSIAASAGMMVPLKGIHRMGKNPNDMINVALVGIRGRGRDHLRAMAKIPNVRISVICDIDERLFKEGIKEVVALTGYKPTTETEYRKVLENPDIDAVSLATPNHWHALQTIWACQAGKDVYVEKPVSHTIQEGRKMVDAARKYGRVVQTGTQSRSNQSILDAIRFVSEGNLGEIHMAKGLCFKPRGSIGYKQNSQIPGGVNWDRFLGPAPYRPFNENRFHYKWHWFWDTGNGDLGNQGIHQTDIGRWVLNKLTHPVKISGFGDYYILDSDQETPNMQNILFEYADRSVLQFEVRGLPTNAEGGVRIGNLVFGSKGWMKVGNEDGGKCEVTFGNVTLKSSGFSSYQEEVGTSFSNPEGTADATVLHFTNFFECMISRNWQDLHADILEGHLSTALCHLGNIATRLKRPLDFNPHAEKFVNDPEADSYLSKQYRHPYVLPAEV